MKFEAVTIKDIAKELGVSISTVSRALRDSHEISQETKKLIIDCAAKLNYHPNPIALSLKEKRSRSIGVVVCEIANVFFSQVINGIESFANEKGYNVIISQSRESCAREVDNLQYLASRSVDGILISLSTETTDVSHIKSLQARGMPIVLFDRINNEIKTHTVTVDNYKGAYLATEHLIKNGFKRIAAVASSDFLSTTNERLAGYYGALKDYHLSYNKAYVQHCFYGGMIFSEVEEAIDKIFALDPKPDAIFTTGDKLTMGCLAALKRKGIQMPQEMGLVGFSNSDLAELLSPPLTIIRQPAEEMGRVATELLIQIIESKREVKSFENRSLMPGLHIRESSVLAR